MNQTKQLVAILAFLLAVAILGYTLVTSPTPTAVDPAVQAQLQGAQLYQAACASCHGQIGRADQCYEQGGGRADCLGRPLNHPDLLCGDVPLRLQAVNWQGDLESYLQAVTTVGRSEHMMPAFGQSYGGSLSEGQIMLISQYIMGWQTDELCQIERGSS